jgi:ribosomal protein L10
VSLADVPDKKTLQAKILGCISGPSRSLVSLVNAVPASLVRVLQARADKLGPAGGAPES